MQLPDLFYAKNELLIQSQVNELLYTNDVSEQYGLRLTHATATMLVQERNRVLKNVGRIEFSTTLTERLIEQFCDSVFIQQDDYAAILVELQEIFYELKNETEDKIPDDELIIRLKDFYEHQCKGDLEFLRTKFLDELAREVRRENQIKEFYDGEGDDQ